MSHCYFPFTCQGKIMEFNTQKSNNKSEQIRWSSDDTPGQAKSYSCTFCKRGFSNAQALGGHMNIHRRDRAKLKQSSEENLLSLDISIKNNTNDEAVIDLEENHHEPPQRGKSIIGTTQLPQRIEEKKADLDLELRLGLEPQESSTLSTRSFF